MLASKPDDIYWAGWKTVNTVDKVDPRQADHWRLYPKYEQQAYEFYRAYERVWQEGSWCLCVDELYYQERVLGLGGDVIKLLTQGRSKRISCVVGMQRPAWVSRFALSEPTHVFCFRLGDKRDLKALRDGVGDELADAVSDLDQYQFAYWHKTKRQLKIGRANDLAKMLGEEVKQ